MSDVNEKWAKRFGATALVNALIAMMWLVLPIFVDTRISRTMAGGSAGTWGYLGFLLFLVVGFGGFVGFSFLYYVIPKITGGNVRNVLSWLHLVLMEVGTLGTTALLGLAGYIGGTTILEETAKGTLAREIQTIVHKKIVFVVEPIPTVALLAGVAALGVLFGIVSIFTSFKGKRN